MRANELATMLHARRIGKGKWMGKCPIHQERTGSVSIRDMGGRISAKCFGCGASGTQIMEALGLRASDLFLDATTMTPEARERLDAIRRMEWLETRAMACAANGYFLEPEKRNYWLAAERRVMAEIQTIKDKLYPEAKAARERREKLDRFLSKFGWEALWQKFEESEKGSAVAQKWGLQ